MMSQKSLQVEADRLFLLPPGLSQTVIHAHLHLAWLSQLRPVDLLVKILSQSGLYGSQPVSLVLLCRSSALPDVAELVVGGLVRVVLFLGTGLNGIYLVDYDPAWVAGERPVAPV